jgi:MscS family membrane protein
MYILENEYYGNSLESWGISLLIIIGALILNKCIVLLNRHVILKLTGKNKGRLDDILFKALEKPVLLGVILASIWVASCRLNISPAVFGMISRSYRFLIVLNFTWFFARFVAGFLEEHTYLDGEPRKKGFRIDARLLPIVKRVFLILIWIIGIMTALNNTGVKITTLLGTLGIGGIAFALAAQDTIKNIFGGVTIFTDQPFRLGDIIRYDAIEGTVQDIGLRSTRILTYDMRVVTVPNFKVMDAAVINVSSEPGRRVVMTLGLTYDTDVEQMQKALDILKGLPDKIAEIHHKDLSATFSDFASSSLDITYIYFIRKSANVREANSKVNFEILRCFNEAGLNFAFPSQTVYLEKV